MLKDIKNLPTPCKSEIEKYLIKWNTLENYVNQENSLKKLFKDIYKDNQDINEVLIKVCSLNDFYSTHILSVFDVAKHIIKLDIDSRLNMGDSTLVNEIALVNIGDKNINFYSFATKYCNHHNPLEFPIYDSYVEKVLMHFKKDNFSIFKKSDLKNYTRYKQILLDFQKSYYIDEYNLKDLDKYLWQLGKEFFNKYPKLDTNAK